MRRLLLFLVCLALLMTLVLSAQAAVSYSDRARYYLYITTSATEMFAAQSTTDDSGNEVLTLVSIGTLPGSTPVSSGDTIQDNYRQVTYLGQDGATHSVVIDKSVIKSNYVTLEIGETSIRVPKPASVNATFVNDYLTYRGISATTEQIQAALNGYGESATPAPTEEGAYYEENDTFTGIELPEGSQTVAPTAEPTPTPEGTDNTEGAEATPTPAADASGSTGSTEATQAPEATESSGSTQATPTPAATATPAPTEKPQATAAPDPTATAKKSGSSKSQATPKPTATPDPDAPDSRVYLRQADQSLVPVEIEELGLSKSTITLNGATELVATDDLVWNTNADAAHRLAIIWAPKTGKANLRKTSDKGSKVLVKALGGKVVRVFDWQEKYAGVFYEGKTGYLLDSVLNYASSGVSSLPGVLSYKGSTTNTHKINLYTQATERSRRLVRLTPGTPCRVISQTDYWSEIEAEGWHGYLYNKFVTILEDEAAREAEKQVAEADQSDDAVTELDEVILEEEIADSPQSARHAGDSSDEGNAEDEEGTKEFYVDGYEMHQDSFDE